MIGEEDLRGLAGARLRTVDVYLIAQIEWAGVLYGCAIAPGESFKVGYSADPFVRVSQLKTASNRNLALFGIILCHNDADAMDAERAVHDILAPWRRRGEWFQGDARKAWLQVEERFPALWLTRYYTIDLESMRLVPFPRGRRAHGGFMGFSDLWHWYHDLKTTGVVQPWPQGRQS